MLIVLRAAECSFAELFLRLDLQNTEALSTFVPEQRGDDMVVLVRCLDNSFAPALESHLEDLVSRGQIAAFLRNGTWIEVARKQEEEYDLPLPKRAISRPSSMIACL